MKKFLPILALLFASSFISAQTVIFTDNFESYTVGQSIGSQNPAWVPWSGATSEDALVSSAQNHTEGGSKSMNVIAGNDMIYSFGNKTTGAYTVDFWYYVATGNQGHVNLQHAFGVEWAFAADFVNGTLSFDQGSITTYPYPQNEWFHITLTFNLDEDVATINLNGTDLTSWPFSSQQNGTPGMNQLGCINFYGPDLNNYFVDDFTFSELVPPVPPADILLETLLVDALSEVGVNPDPAVVLFSNIGEENLIFTAFPTFQDPSVASTLVSGVMNYDSDNASAIGWSAAEPFDVHAAVKIKNDISSAHIGQEIVSVDIYINHLPIGDVTVYVWEKGSSTPSSPSTTILSQKTFTPVAETWNTVTLTTPVRVTGDEIWVGYKFTEGGAGVFTLGTDEEPTVSGVNYLKTGVAWSEFDGVGGSLIGNFNIRANVTGLGWPTWLSIDTQTGTVPAFEQQTLNLAFNTTGLPEGVYHASVVIRSNDPDENWSDVPVNLSIGTGIDNTTKIGVMTYPNPATDNLNVVADVNINSIAIYSITGQIVSKFNVNSTSTIINVSDMASGIYVMEITAGNSVVNSKFIVK